MGSESWGMPRPVERAVLVSGTRKQRHTCAFNGLPEWLDVCREQLDESVEAFDVGCVSALEFEYRCVWQVLAKRIDDCPVIGCAVAAFDKENRAVDGCEVGGRSLRIRGLVEGPRPCVPVHHPGCP